MEKVREDYGIAEMVYLLSEMNISQEEINKIDIAIGKKKENYDKIAYWSICIIGVIASFILILIFESVRIPLISSFINFISTAILLISMVFLVIGIMKLFYSHKNKTQFDVQKSPLLKVLNINKHWNEYALKNNEIKSMLIKDEQEKENYKYCSTVYENHKADYKVATPYRNVYALVWLYIYLLTGRADDLKEAINLFEEEEHRGRLEKDPHRYTADWEEVRQQLYDLGKTEVGRK